MFRKYFSPPKEKLNPAQPLISLEAGSRISSETYEPTYKFYYENLEPVNRAVNMIVDDCADIKYDVLDSLESNGIRKKRLFNLLNFKPNPFQDRNAFQRDIFLDLMLDGNAFIYDDGEYIYRVPAKGVSIITHKTEYVEEYRYLEQVSYDPDEIIHIKDNNISSGYRGVSRLKPATKSMRRLKSMLDFQDNFFDNGAVPGLVLKSPNALSDKIKQRMIEGWLQTYNPKNGGRRPLILDGGLEIDKISNVNFRELDFETSVKNTENSIYRSLGVPPILMEGGNNANIRPNHRLYYLETIIPMINKYISALEKFYGYKIVAELADVPGMQPELKELSAYFVTLTNGGIIKPDEAREGLNFEKLGGDMDKIRVPANIAGSATNPDQGGRPKEDNDE